MRAGVLAGLGLLLSLSLVTLAHLAALGDETVPWRKLPITEANLGPPERPARQIPDSARPCRARDVTFRIVSSGPVNSLVSVYGFELRNVGTRTCVVRSGPRAAARRVRISYPRGQMPFALWPGGSAGAELFATDCEEPPWTPTRGAVVQVGYVTRTTSLSIRSCQAGTPGLEVQPFRPPPPPETRRERFPLRATTHVPSRARAGETLRFLVELENTSSKPFRFPYCPVQEFGVMGAGRMVSSLNCHAAGEIDPGDRATFELRAPLLAEARAGRAELYWHMDDGTFLGALVARDAIELRGP
jgi:hypothetical protein